MSAVQASDRLSEAVEEVIRSFVSSRRHGAAHYVNLPLLYPDGSCVTLKIEQTPDGGVHVSDNGFAYREAEAVGAERSFGNTASAVAERRGVDSNRRAVFTVAPIEHLFRAICEVGAASWEVADRMFSRLDEREEEEVEVNLRERLAAVFGHHRLSDSRKMIGASCSEWEVSAVVNVDAGHAVFQFVAERAPSIYRTVTAFHDLAELEQPPRLVAVVHDKRALGTRLGLLSQAGRVIEDAQPDEVFLRAVA